MSDTDSFLLSEGPSVFCEHAGNSRLKLSTNLLNVKNIINYIPSQFKHLFHLFPFRKIYLCFSSRSDDVNRYNSHRAYSKRESKGMGQVSGHSASWSLQQSAVGLEGDVEGHAGSETRKKNDPFFIIVDCLSLWFPSSIHCFYPHPHIALSGFPSLPIIA